MAKLPRRTQKIFGVNAPVNQITAFGSVKAGDVEYTQDVGEIQTDAFTTGWAAAVQEDYAPYRQDRNALDLVTTKQLAYVFQEGIPEWDGGTTYYKGGIVKNISEDGSAKLYESIVDNNINNPLTDVESWRELSLGGGGGLEIGDIGFAPLGVDETKNLRRYLNGQVISQSQFQSFTTKLKSAVALNPNLATTETNWQATVTNSPYGICDKFVIDDTIGTIRLPKYPNWGLREVGTVPVVGNGMNLGVTDGTTESGITGYLNTGGSRLKKAEFGGMVGGSQTGDLSGSSLGVTTDGTKSGIIANLVNATSEDKILGKWFIQVATGSEESIDVSTEIQLNNPFSLLDYKWSEYELSNVSWLLSNGAFQSGATYTSVYQLLLKIYNGTETKEGVSVKLSTETYTDYDFVLNTTDTTFRLPVKVKLASGNAVAGNGMTMGFTNGQNNFGFTSNTDITFVAYQNNYGKPVSSATPTGTGGAVGTLGLTTDPAKSGIETSSQGLKLYFYVGETVQDANVINATGVLTRVAELSDSYISGLGMPSEEYIDLELKASGSIYTAEANGFICVEKQSSASTGVVAGGVLKEGKTTTNPEDRLFYVASYSPKAGFAPTIFFPVLKGYRFFINYDVTGTILCCRFIYAEGEI